MNAKRFIVDEKVADEFVAAFTARTQELVVGDPTDRATTIGPMARENLRAELHDQVKRTVETGGKLILGGNIVDGPGYYYEPTIIDHVAPDRPPSTRKPSAPSPPIIRVSSTEEAIALANQTEYGLGAACGPQTPRRRAPTPAADRRRRRVHQRHGRLRPAPALRRHQEVRLRPRTRLLRHPGIHQHENLLDRPGTYPDAVD